jgi:hypothetical protein
VAAQRFGVHRLLEAEADRLIFGSLKGVTSHTAKKDILTPWKYQERLRREVFSASGRPDGNVRRGMYGRRTNPARPDMNSRDGQVRPRPRGGGLEAHVEEYGKGRSADGAGFG